MKRKTTVALATFLIVPLTGTALADAILAPGDFVIAIDTDPWAIFLPPVQVSQ